MTGKRSPAFTGTVAVTLALSIGANTGIFRLSTRFCNANEAGFRIHSYFVRGERPSLLKMNSVLLTSTFYQMIERRLGGPRTETAAFSVFALAALFLAAVGVDGVIAYSVAQRQKEIR